MKKILVAIDFSDASKSALAYAAHFAKEQQAELHVLHVCSPQVIDPYISISVEQTMLKSQLESHEEKLYQFVKKFKESFDPNFEVFIHVELGMVAERIHAFSKEGKFDLLFLGLSKGSRLVKKIIGTVNQKLIQTCSTPIFIIPEDYEYRSIENISYATNFAQEDRRVLNWLKGWFIKPNTFIRCLHLRQENPFEEWLQEKKFLKSFANEIETHELDLNSFTAVSISQGIRQHMEKFAPDVLVMLTHKRNLLSQLFHFSHTKSVALSTQIPLLIFQMESFGVNEETKESIARTS